MKRGLLLAKYDTLAASTRQRFVQAMPYLQAAGITLDIEPLFDNDYLSALFSKGNRNRKKILKSYWNRLLALRRIPDYDFVWVNYELFPYLPGFMETMISSWQKAVIYDCDDALFHQYNQHKNPLIRKMLGNKIVPLLRRCDLAFCGNAYLEAYVKPHCPNTVIIPTTVDVDSYAAVHRTPEDRPTIGWIGSPSTWRYCLPLTDMLNEFITSARANMLVVGAQHAANTADPFEFRNWSEANEITDIQSMDIGIMPLPDEPWARGKCGYKLIQYMACGIPVIASPVGVNCEIVNHGVNGFLASSEEEWRSAITQLLGDTGLRKRMGQAGRATVEQRYSIQQYGPIMAQHIQELLASQL